MKFGEQLSSHLTPEWRKQYICYEALKSMLYEMMTGLPTEPEARDQKFHELNAELMAFKEALENRGTQSVTDPTSLRQRIKRRSIPSRNIIREQAKTAQQLKLAFSEFYLALVLLQNYQQLNATGFRKILKKHDKLMENERGLDWRISRVEKSSFFLNREVETLINNVERDVINDLEGGNRQAGMKRLKVPPLSEKQHATTTFTLGLFLGAFIVLGIAILISWFATESRYNEPKWVAVRLFRGPLLLLLQFGFVKPYSISQRNSRFWILKHCFNCFSAPLHFVTFIDFWLGDQMNSLVTSFLDFQYFICFYTTEVDYSDWTLSVRTVNMSTNEPIPWGYVDINTGRDMCTSSSGIRVLVSIFPATVRFMQCLRRFRDTGHAHPHLINAGKYSTTYLVFCLYISLGYIHGLGSYRSNGSKDSPFLREEMIYGSKWYYYGAIVEDFILRLSWVLNISLGEAWTMESDLLTCITAPLEVFRRFIWNYFRLENEHINNCGQFRAVRDISVKPIKKEISNRCYQKWMMKMVLVIEVKILGYVSRSKRNHLKIEDKSCDVRDLLELPSVLQCGRAGYLSVGLELNIPLILYSRWKAHREHLSHLTKFYRKDIFKADLKQYKTAIIFGTETLWLLLCTIGNGFDGVWLYEKIR
ncbi:Xenotropic and polytropic retrovirus receptor 1 [Dirofilaria immitis]|nr:Xenotropic and polytropic retrovirus receptor 1 [Dirofilaria immitis]